VTFVPSIKGRPGDPGAPERNDATSIIVGPRLTQVAPHESREDTRTTRRVGFELSFTRARSKRIASCFRSRFRIPRPPKLARAYFRATCRSTFAATLTDGIRATSVIGAAEIPLLFRSRRASRRVASTRSTAAALERETEDKGRGGGPPVRHGARAGNYGGHRR